MKLLELFGLRPATDLRATDVEGHLEDILECHGADMEWQEFTRRPIRDPRLDRIRQEAATVELPLSAAGRATLIDLLERVRPCRR